MSDSGDSRSPEIELGVQLPSGAGASVKLWIDAALRAIAPTRALRNDTRIALAKSAIEKITGGGTLSRPEAEAFVIVWGPEAARAERIARKVAMATDILASGRLLPGEVRGDDASAPKPQPPPGPWFDRWQFGAGFDSEPHVEEFWSRILAGQIRRPVRFCLQSLAVLPELDDEIAAAFVRLCRFAFDGWAIPAWRSFVSHYDQAGLPYQWFLRFDAARLINFQDSAMMRPAGADYDLTAAGARWRIAASSATLPIHTLTSAGKDLAGISDIAYPPECAQAIGAWLNVVNPGIEIVRAG